MVSNYFASSRIILYNLLLYISRLLILNIYQLEIQIDSIRFRIQFGGNNMGWVKFYPILPITNSEFEGKYELDIWIPWSDCAARFHPKIQEISWTNIQVEEMSSTNASYIKCHHTSDFTPKISLSLGFCLSHVKCIVHPITINGKLLTEP